MAGSGKVFGLNTLHRRKILPETALPLDLAAAIKPCATFASEHREQVAGGMNLNYTIGCYPCHRKQTNNVISVSFLVAQILFVIVKTCSDSLFTIGSKNCQLFVAKLGNFLHSHNRMAFY